jgi:O-antigen biosynthesis protein WbqP
MIRRLFDIGLATSLLILLSVPMILIAAAVKLTSKGRVLHWSQRVGRNNQLFSMPKFRTMRQDAPQLATHLFCDADAWVTSIGRLLRSTSLDELPQLYSIVMGHMSFVGPRPALFNQDDLIALRTRRGIQVLSPGLTGWTNCPCLSRSILTPGIWSTARSCWISRLSA